MAYGNSNRIDLNSQWVSDTTDDEYNYFKSDSYEVEEGLSYSQCKVTWSGLTSVTFKYMSSSDMGGLLVLKLDSEKYTLQTSDDDIYLTTWDTTPGTYNEFTIECDEGEHHIWFGYTKDEGTTDEDRGFIGVPKYVVSILDVKQGSELPTEYKYGGVSAEGGKTYNINFNNVTLPTGIVPSYEDYTKTEKAINTEYVDLGLPSRLKWAKCNIGATTETDYGVYFQWGETSGISGSLLGKYSDENYDWAGYKYCNGTEDTLTKYNTDGKTTLDSEDDAARVHMGDDWRMPTEAEVQELLKNTNQEWVTINGVKGRKFTSRIYTSNYIFIPAAGGCDDGSVYDVGHYGHIWSSSLNGSNPNRAWRLYFDSVSCYMNYYNRYFGYSVRGVRN